MTGNDKLFRLKCLSLKIELLWTQSRVLATQFIIPSLIDTWEKQINTSPRTSISLQCWTILIWYKVRIELISVLCMQIQFPFIKIKMNIIFKSSSEFSFDKNKRAKYICSALDQANISLLNFLYQRFRNILLGTKHFWNTWQSLPQPNIWQS